MDKLSKLTPEFAFTPGTILRSSRELWRALESSGETYLRVFMSEIYTNVTNIACIYCMYTLHLVHVSPRFHVFEFTIFLGSAGRAEPLLGIISTGAPFGYNYVECLLLSVPECVEIGLLESSFSDPLWAT
jgi:hypothetical protein